MQSRAADFYNSVYSTAKELGATDVQAHLAAAQASQETGYGQHVAGDNYFGIKTGSSYEGPSVNVGTHEVIDGQSVGMNDSFRAYDGLPSSVKGYMDFMADKFPASWNAPTIEDAASNLTAGKFGSYATDPNYTNAVTSIANRFAPTVEPAPMSSFFDTLPGVDPMAGLLPSAMTMPQAQPVAPDTFSGLLAPAPVEMTSLSPAGPTLAAASMTDPNPFNAIQAAQPSIPSFSQGLLATENAIPSSYTPPSAIAGPATDQIAPASEQQTAQVAAQQPSFGNVASFPAAPKQAGLLDKMGMSKQSVLGGILGGAVLGPLGALGGGLLGNYLSNNPQGLSGLLGSFQNQPMTINNLGTGMTAMQGVYGPGATRGNSFTANNGATVTARGDGSVNYTSPSGVHEVHDADGNVASVW